MAQSLPARHLVLKAVASATTATIPQTDIQDGVPLPEPGQMQLFSFYQPGLVAGEYNIKVDQKVRYEGVEKSLNPLRAPLPEQKFKVIAPRFALPQSVFHSTYPAQGQADQPSILPHIVFNDPDLPWERPVKADNDDADNVVPWLALFPFDCNRLDDPELRLTDLELSHINQAVKPLLPIKPSASFSLAMKLQDYFDLPKTVKGVSENTTTKIRVPPFKDIEELEVDKNLPVEVIFLRGALYKKIFFNKKKQPSVDDFRYCAHVRNINTQGITGAGTSDTGLFSIIHSKRSGPTDVAQGAIPRSQAVHLVSLESIDDINDVLDETKTDGSKIPPLEDTELVALISLYRWNYLCQPPLGVDVVDALRDLGISMKFSQLGEDGIDDNERTDLDAHMKDTPPNCYLRCSNKVLETFEERATKPETAGAPNPLAAVKEAMVNRLKNGYNLVRYRVQSGEETVALSRGALLPVYPGAPPESWPFTSNNGQDYQIFDKQLGLMDISYSSAWQLGRIMATSDIGFVSALMRIRTRAYQNGLIANGIIAAHTDLGVKSQKNFFASLPGSVDRMQSLSSASKPAPIVDLRSRWDRTGRSLNSSLEEGAFAAGVESSISKEGSAAGTNGNVPIQDLFPAASDDWRIVHDWILDRMYLSGIPTHYLISDPNLLTPESIRFFHIDYDWMDCYIDGALSCANHSSLNDQDVIREIIKSQFNVYLGSKILRDPGNHSAGVLHYPQVPIFGFFVRSAVVSAFKDLIVEVPFSDDVDTTGRASILVQKRLGSDILMVLLDRIPDGKEIQKIKFTQPPHQQRFAAADYLNKETATFQFRKMYYPEDTEGNAWESIPDGFLDQFGPEVNFFNDEDEDQKDKPTPAAGSPDPASEETEETKKKKKENDRDTIYSWKNRCLDFENLNKLFFDSAFHNGTFKTFPNFHTESWQPARRHLTSAFVGIQLNDTMKYLEILPPIDPPKENPEDKPKDTPGGTPSPAPNDPSTGAPKPPAADTPKTPPRKAPVIKRPYQIRTRPADQKRIAARGILKSIESGTPTDKPSPPGPSTTPTTNTGPIITPIQQQSGLPPSTLIKTITTPKPKDTGPGANDRSPRNLSASFKCIIFPRDVRFTKDLDDSFVWRDIPYAGDLVFSIRRIGRENIMLNEYVITIPLGPSKDRKKTDKTPNVIDGPGLAPVGNGGVRARMLSNQRWVPTLDPGTNTLTVRLIPRSLAKKYPLNFTNEISFILSGVDTGWQSGKAQENETNPPVKIQTTEIYGKDRLRDQGTSSNFIRVTKRAGWKE